MLRQEASLARQFDRSLRLLLTLRGAMPGTGQTKEHGKSKAKRQRSKGKEKLHERTNEGPRANSGHEGKSANSRQRKARKSPKSKKQSRYLYESTRGAAGTRNPIPKAPARITLRVPHG
jgi:phage protein D